eukprot:8390846-Ditylum_brightwellii.AAC.1
MWRHRPSAQVIKKCANYRRKEDVDTRDEESVERHDEEEESIDDDENEVDATYESRINYPDFIELESRRNRMYEPVVDVVSSMFRSHDTVFQVTGKDYRDRVMEVEASSRILMEKYFPDIIVTELYKQTTNTLINEERNILSCIAGRKKE